MGWMTFTLALTLMVGLGPVCGKPLNRDVRHTDGSRVLDLLECLTDPGSCGKEKKAVESLGKKGAENLEKKAVAALEKELLGKLSERLEHETRESHSARTVTQRTIYYNAIIYTVDTSTSWHLNPHQAMVVEGATILYVGTELGAEGFHQQGAVWVDLYGETVLPGIHDVHQHPLEAKSEAGAACIFTENDDLESIGAQITSSKCGDQQVGTPWVLGHGHSIMKVLEHLDTQGARSPRDILDEAESSKPMVLMEATSHSVLANSLALQMAGITASSPDVTGGVVWKDADGEPNGVLLENAGNVMMSLALTPNTDLDYYNYQGLKAALKEMNTFGITSMCDARCYWKRGHDVIWRKLLTNEPDKFTVRAILGLWAAPEVTDDVTQIQALKDRYSNDPDSLLRVSQIKVYSDGLLQTTTAAMLEPYLVNYNLQGLEGNVGINYFRQGRLKDYIDQLQDFRGNEGFDFHVHAIGDRGVREVINAMEQAGGDDVTARHRITHVETVSPTDVARFAPLGVIADFQVAGDFTLPQHKGDVAELIGQIKADFQIPVKTMVDSGAKVTLSSDWDVSPLNPFIGMQHALERGAESVDIRKAVELYTINPAYVMRQEDKVGSLVAGKEADFIVIDTDILWPDNKPYIKDTKVTLTVLKGKAVYDRYGK